MRFSRLFVLGVLAASPAFSATATAQSSAEQLTFFGFLNQGYGVSGAQPILGLNKDASSDYRVGAVQVRFAITPVDNFVVQAVTRSLGTSPLSNQSGNVNLDWAFYHHRFDFASVRLGRIPAPFGFLAETREAGTLLPFYRAPAGYYFESFRSIDGAMATHELGFAGGRLETSVFGGGTNGTDVTWLPPNMPVPSVTTPLRFERLMGTQVVYTTPLDGIRLLGGVTQLRFLDTAKVQIAPASKIALANVGIDARFERAFARGEARRLKNGSDSRQYSYYAQAGVSPVAKLWINVQGDFTEDQAFVPAAKTYMGRMSSADRAASLSYQFLSNVVAKVEQHWAKGGIDGFVDPSGPLPDAHYSIASFAVSF
jgi:hypothetical protein